MEKRAKRKRALKTQHAHYILESPEGDGCGNSDSIMLCMSFIADLFRGQELWDNSPSEIEKSLQLAALGDIAHEGLAPSTKRYRRYDDGV